MNERQMCDFCEQEVEEVRALSDPAADQAICQECEDADYVTMVRFVHGNREADKAMAKLEKERTRQG